MSTWTITSSLHVLWRVFLLKSACFIHLCVFCRSPSLKTWIIQVPRNVQESTENSTWPADSYLNKTSPVYNSKRTLIWSDRCHQSHILGQFLSLFERKFRRGTNWVVLTCILFISLHQWRYREQYERAKDKFTTVLETPQYETHKRSKKISDVSCQVLSCRCL